MIKMKKAQSTLDREFRRLRREASVGRGLTRSIMLMAMDEVSLLQDRPSILTRKYVEDISSQKTEHVRAEVCRWALGQTKHRPSFSLRDPSIL